MFDRSIGIAGLSLALIFGILQYFLPELPRWASIAGILLGVLALGISIGLLVVGRGNRPKPLAKTAMLRLHSYGDHRAPDHLAGENLFRWYLLKNEVNIMDSTGQQNVVTTSILFLTFEPDVIPSTLYVRSPDMALPRYEVKDFNQRFAIVVFSGVVPVGTLELTVTSTT